MRIDWTDPRLETAEGREQMRAESRRDMESAKFALRTEKNPDHRRELTRDYADAAERIHWIDTKEPKP